MAYLVLARKYRPQRFEDIVGQDQVTQTLANAITADRVAHAYLFCGPRGVGKTTAARILAKALNCDTAPTSTPCNTCPSCKSITSGSSMDVLEIDGASNRGINEVRELRENTRYAPAEGRHKMYIIDEVHMLTTEAFNALLKTLEEPPSHVTFVLATTDPFKVPGTILSRCQRFDFARIPSRDIAVTLQRIAADESIDVGEDALAVIARRAQGGLRDALSLFDQVIAGAPQGTIDRLRVEQLLGLVGEEFFFGQVEALAAGNAGAALEALNTVYLQGASMEEVARGMARHLRDLYVLRVHPKLESLVEVSPSEIPRFVDQAGQFAPELLNDMLSRAAQVSGEIKRSENPRLSVELLLAELAERATRMPLADLAARLAALETGAPAEPTASGGQSKARTSSPAASPSSSKQKPKPRSEASAAGTPPPPKVSAPAPASAVPETPAASAEEPKDDAPAEGTPAATWLSCLERIKSHNIILWGTLAGVAVDGAHDDGRLMLRPEPSNNMQKTALTDTENRKLLLAELDKAGCPGFVLPGDSPAAPGAPADAGDPEPPQDERELGEIFKDEPKLQRVLDMFDGEVLP